MKKQYLIVVSGISFIEDPMKHTVYYSGHAKELTKDGEDNWRRWEGVFKSVIVDVEDFEAGVEILREDVESYLKNVWFIHDHGNVKDFRFEIRFTEFVDGRGWLIPCSTFCAKYNVCSRNVG